MYTASQQREIQDWYSMWSKMPITRENIQQLCRGPFKDFQKFLCHRARSDEFIETMRTNIYLHTGTKDESISQEIDDTIFADQLEELKRLEADLKGLQLQVETKLDTLQNKGEMNDDQSLEKKKLTKILNEKIKETSSLLSTVEMTCHLSIEPASNGEKSHSENGNNSIFESLSNEAHRAFESAILRHYISDPYSSREISTSSAQLTSLVSQMMNEEFYGQVVVDWMRQEWLNHIQICFRRNQQLQADKDNPSIVHNMSSKTHDTLVAWSQNHIQINSKNKTREKLVHDSILAIQSYQNACISNPNIGYRLGDFLSLIRRATLSAQVIRCRQYANKTTNPIESLFNNVSLDGYQSPAATRGNKHNGVKYVDSFQPWVSAISKSEHLQEILTVLQKTWGTARHNLSDKISLVNETCESLPNLLLQTSKYACDPYLK